MSIYTEVGGSELTHMLGYVKPKAWASALRDEEFKVRNKDIILMIVEQEATYDYDLMADVLDEIEEMKGKKFRDTIETVYREVVYELQDRGYERCETDYPNEEYLISYEVRL